MHLTGIIRPLRVVLETAIAQQKSGPSEKLGLLAKRLDQESNCCLDCRYAVQNEAARASPDPPIDSPFSQP